MPKIGMTLAPLPYHQDRKQKGCRDPSPAAFFIPSPDLTQLICPDFTYFRGQAKQALRNHPNSTQTHQLLHPVNKQPIRRHLHLAGFQYRAELARLFKVQQELPGPRRLLK